MRAPFAVGFLVLAACGARTAPSIETESLPPPSCTWTFAGVPQRVSEPSADDATIYFEFPVDAVPVDGGALVAWTTERNGPRRVMVRRLAWDLGSNGNSHVVFERYPIFDSTVTLASGFGHTAIAAGSSRVLVQPLTPEGVPVGAWAQLAAGSSFDLHATSAGFDVFVDSLQSQLDRLDLARLDPTGSELSRVSLFGVRPMQPYAARPGRGTFPDGSFLATAWNRDNRSPGIFLRHFGSDGAPLGPTYTLPTADQMRGIDDARVPVVPVSGGALVGWTERTDAGSRLLVRPLSFDGAPRGDAVSIDATGPGGVVRAFDLQADASGGALVAWTTATPPVGRPPRIQSLAPTGQPYGPPLDWPSIPGHPFSVEDARLVLEEQHGLLLFAAYDDGPKHVYAVPLACVP